MLSFNRHLIGLLKAKLPPSVGSVWAVLPEPPEHPWNCLQHHLASTRSSSLKPHPDPPLSSARYICEQLDLVRSFLHARIIHFTQGVTPLVTPPGEEGGRRWQDSLHFLGWLSHSEGACPRALWEMKESCRADPHRPASSVLPEGTGCWEK